MIKNWLSRYSLRYPRSLVYMLQASEYKVPDYFNWYKRTRDFNNVEKRKHLVKTPKSVLLLVIVWAATLALYAGAIYSLWFFASPVKYFVFLLVLLLSPYVLAYGITLMLFVAKVFIQSPIEYFIVRSARHRLASHAAIKIAVAGSFGKTSMREILKTVLLEGKKVAAPPHSYNTLLGISQFIKSLKGDEEVLIFELGEYYPGDIRELCELVHPQLGIITGVNEAHLQKFKSIDKTVGTIFELSEYLGDKSIYVNGENELARNNASKDSVVYTKDWVGGLRVEDLHTDLSGTSFALIKDNIRLEIKSKLLGLHQVGPLVASADIAFKLGLSPNEIQRGLNKTKPFDYRLEPKVDASGVTTLDDSYNGNPDGVKAVIDFLSALKDHRRFYVTPGLVEMGVRTEEVHKIVGMELAGAGIEKVILIKNSVTGYIEQGLREANYRGEVLWFDDALAAFAALPQLTVKGDVVLLQNDWPDQYQ